MGLETENLFLSIRRLKILGKCRKERLVPFDYSNDRILLALHRYLGISVVRVDRFQGLAFHDDRTSLIHRLKRMTTFLTMSSIKRGFDNILSVTAFSSTLLSRVNTPLLADS